MISKVIVSNKSLKVPTQYAYAYCFSMNIDSNVTTISSHLSIFEAAQLFYTSKKKRFPVMNGQVLVGQISQSDIVRAILNINNVSSK